VIFDVFDFAYYSKNSGWYYFLSNVIACCGGKAYLYAAFGVYLAQDFYY
jgi:hypothetical protein